MVFIASSLGVRILTFLPKDDQKTWMLSDRLNFESLAVHALVDFCATIRNRTSQSGFPLAWLVEPNVKLTDEAAVALTGFPVVPEASPPAAPAPGVTLAPSMEADGEETELSMEALAHAVARNDAKVLDDKHAKLFEDALDHVGLLATLYYLRPAALTPNAVAELILSSFGGRPSLWLDRHSSLAAFIKRLLVESPTTATVVTVTANASFTQSSDLWSLYEGGLLVHSAATATDEAATQVIAAIDAARKNHVYAIGSPKAPLPRTCRLVYSPSCGRRHRAVLEYVANEPPLLQVGKDSPANEALNEARLFCDSARFVPHNAYSSFGGVEKADVSEMPHIEAFEGNFLADCPKLTVVDLKPLVHLTSTGCNFLANSPVHIVDINHMKRLRHVGNRFLAGSRKLNQLLLDRPLPTITRIGNDFLRASGPLVYARLGHLFPNVESVGSGYCADLSHIATIDIAGMTKIKNIGSNFLAHNPLLTDVNLPDLSHLTRIPDGFLHGSKVKSVNMDPFKGVTQIGHNFLANPAGNPSLTAMSLAELRLVTRIGKAFLRGCEALKELDFSTFANLRSLGPSFLDGCTGLQTLVLPTSWGLTALPDRFLYDCRALVNIVNMSCLSPITSVGNCCFTNCVVLPPFDLSIFSNVTNIGHKFLLGSTTVTELNFSKMPKLTTVGRHFISRFHALRDVVMPVSLLALPQPGCLSGCGSLRTFDVTMWKTVDVLPKGFLAKSYVPEFDVATLLPQLQGLSTRCLYGSGIESLDLVGMQHLTSIDDDCFVDCDQLRKAVFASLPKLASIGNRVLSSCSRLRQVIVDDLPQLASIGEHFASECKNLHHVSIRNTSGLTNVGSYFCEECPQLRDGGTHHWGTPDKLDLSGLANLVEVPLGFFKDSHATSITLQFPHATKVDDDVVQACSRAVELTVDLPLVTDIGSCFASSCPQLTRISLHVPSLTTVQRDFMFQNALTMANLNSLTCLSEVGTGFWSSGKNGESDPAQPFVISLPQLVKMSPSFMSQVSRVVHLHIRNMPALISVGNCSFNLMADLETFILEECPLLTEVGDRVLAESRRLKCVTLSNLPQLHGIGPGFASESPALAVLSVHAPALKGILDHFASCADDESTAAFVLDLSQCDALEVLEVGALQGRTIESVRLPEGFVAPADGPIGRHVAKLLAPPSTADAEGGEGGAEDDEADAVRQESDVNVAETPQDTA